MKKIKDRLLKKFLLSMIFNLSIVLIEITGGLISGSLVLLSDALHNTTDVISLMFSYVARKISTKKATDEFTYGFKRAEIVAALVNSIFMMILSAFLLYEGIHRFFDPRSIEINVMLPVAIVGLIGNLMTLLILHRESRSNLNLKSALIHIISDTLSSVLVIITALVIRFYEIQWLDAVFTMMIVGYLSTLAFKIFIRSSRILMQAVPKGWSVKDIVKNLKKIPGVVDVHHIHLWTLEGEKVYSEFHVVFEGRKDDDILEDILKETKKMGIDHATVQLESSRFHENFDESCEHRIEH